MSTRETTLPVESRLPGFDGADRLAQLAAADAGRACAAASCWSTSGRTRASTGCERSATSGPGPSATATTGWWWSACTRRSSPSSAIIDNVRRAVADMDVAYPVALDTDYAVWQAFSNHYWPAIYIADAEGRIRYHHFGEEAYDGSGAGDPATAARRGPRRRSVTTSSPSFPAASRRRPTGPTWGRPRPISATSRAATWLPPTAQIGAPATFAVPDALPLNGWALGGDMDDRGAGGGAEPARRIASRSGSTHATSTWSCAPARGPRCRSGCWSTARRPGRPTASTSTRAAAGRWSSPGSTSSFGSRARSPTAPSRSPSQRAGVEAYVFTFG